MGEVAREDRPHEGGLLLDDVQRAVLGVGPDRDDPGRSNAGIGQLRQAAEHQVDIVEATALNESTASRKPAASTARQGRAS